MEKVDGSPELDLSEWRLFERDVSSDLHNASVEAAEFAVNEILSDASVHLELNDDDPIRLLLWVSFDQSKEPIKYEIPLEWEIRNNVIGAHHESEDPRGFSEQMRRLSGRLRQLAEDLDREAAKRPESAG